MLWFDAYAALLAAMLDAYELWFKAHPGRRVELRLVSEDGHEPVVSVTVVRYL